MIVGAARLGDMSTQPVHIIVPGPGQESVWDYPRPPRVEPVKVPLRVELAGVVIAETIRGLRVLETASAPVYYFPREDVRLDHLTRGRARSVCEWKGEASYWTVTAGGRTVIDGAWSYEHPSPGYESIRRHLAFYARKMDACFVGGERATPQPGYFYGGWVTSNIVGPIKGEPGTEEW
jgi:uncharacterized protein (DUF427 family)